MNSSELGISIATRNRWRDVEKTLAAIAAHPELAACPVVVANDGSKEPPPEGFVRRHPGVLLIGSETHLGASEQRTRIVRLLPTEFVLQLDDDSYPVAGSISAAVDFLRGRPEAAALALNILLADQSQPPIDPADEPYPIEVFVGCGVILRRSVFLDLGGYCSALGYYFEENHFCARAIREGHAVYLFPSVVVRHEKSSQARSFARIAYYKGRNRVLLVLWHYPLGALPLRLATSLPGTFALVRPLHYPAALAGFFKGILDGLLLLRLRHPLSSRQYRAWRNLPSCYTPRQLAAPR